MWDCLRCEKRLCDGCRRSCDNCEGYFCGPCHAVAHEHKSRPCVYRIDDPDHACACSSYERCVHGRYVCAGTEVAQCTQCGVRSVCVWHNECYEDTCCRVTRERLVCCECRHLGYPFLTHKRFCDVPGCEGLCERCEGDVATCEHGAKVCRRCDSRYPYACEVCGEESRCVTRTVCCGASWGESCTMDMLCCKHWHPRTCPGIPEPLVRERAPKSVAVMERTKGRFHAVVHYESECDARVCAPQEPFRSSDVQVVDGRALADGRAFENRTGCGRVLCPSCELCEQCSAEADLRAAKEERVRVFTVDEPVECIVCACDSRTSVRYPGCRHAPVVCPGCALHMDKCPYNCEPPEEEDGQAILRRLADFCRARILEQLEAALNENGVVSDESDD